MNKDTILENSDNKLLDNQKDSKHINENLNITNKTEKYTSEKNFITKNGKKYYKTNKPYIYKCEENYFAYRIVNKHNKINLFIKNHIETKERFHTQLSAYLAQQEHLSKLNITNDCEPIEVQYNGISIFPIVSLLISIATLFLFKYMFSTPELIFIWIASSFLSVVMPVISKRIRLLNNKKGKLLEIIALVIGAFSFFDVIIYILKLPDIIGYLCWVVFGLVYKSIK